MMAKYMLIMRATDDTVAKMMETPFEEMLETVGRFNEELIRAGVLVAAEGAHVRRGSGRNAGHDVAVHSRRLAEPIIRNVRANRVASAQPGHPTPRIVAGS
jgi:hypothetical protein